MKVPCGRVTAIGRHYGGNHERKARAEPRGFVRRKPEADPRADGQKRHRRPECSGASRHHTAKPSDSGATVNGAVVRGRRTLLSGEACPTGGGIVTGAGLRSIPKGVDKPPDPTDDPAASLGVIPGVFGQESAEAIVPRCWREGLNLGGQEVNSVRSSSGGVEPDRVSHPWATDWVRPGLPLNGVILFTLQEPPGADPHNGWCGLSITHKSRPFYRRAFLNFSMLVSTSCSIIFLACA